MAVLSLLLSILYVGLTSPSPSSAVTPTWADITVSGRHTCALDHNGQIWCWGLNPLGELGNGTETDQGSPTLVSAPGVVFSKVSAQGNHTCAIAGTDLYCWGGNYSGQLGFGDNVDRYVPTKLPGLAVKDVSAGDLHTCAIRTDDKLICWGENNYGQLGTGNNTEYLSPQLIDPGNSYSKVVAGWYFNCAIRIDSQVACWGDNSTAQLGLGDSGYSTNRLVPTVQASSTGTTQINANESYACAIRASGTYCWGANWSGQLGDNTATERASPTLVLGGHIFTSIAPGYDTTCAVDSAGDLWCWGRGSDGMLGNGSTVDSFVPVRATTTSTYRLVRADDNFCALTTTDNLHCWGNTSFNQTNSTNASLNVTSPTALYTTRTWNGIASGRSFWCGIDAANANRVFCYGEGRLGQIGDGSFSSVNTLTQISDSSAYTKLAATESTICGLTGTTIKCWGLNGTGQLGIGTNDWASNTPVVVSGSHTFSDLAASGRTVCGLDSTGYAWCWGEGVQGQLGNGSSVNSNVPVRVQTSPGNYPTFSSISVGGNHVCGVTLSGGNRPIYCWGRNTEGQLGIGSYGGNYNQAQSVAGAYSAISAGRMHTCATLKNSTMQCWGRNNEGQLGTGAGSANVPTSIAGPTLYFSQVNSSLDTTCAAAISPDTIYCWGSNRSGNIGNGTLTNQPTPVAVAVPSSFLGSNAFAKNGQMNYSEPHGTCVINSASKLYCWGSEVFPTGQVYLSTPTKAVFLSGTATGVAQFRSDGSTPLAVGGAVSDTSTVIEATASSLDPTEQLRLCVEAKPVGTAFDGTNTACSAASPNATNGTTMSVTLSSLGIYHWRWQVESSLTGYTPYASYGNNAESAPDFILDNTTPALSGITIYRDDGTTALPVGAWATASPVVVKATGTSYSGGTFCVEAKPITVAFDGTNLACGPTVHTFPTVALSVDLSSLAQGAYHLRARFTNGLGTNTAWVNYGSNADTLPADRDFGLDSVAPAVGTAYDGLAAPLQESVGGSQLHSLSASWLGFSDAGSGIAAYDVAVGTTPGGTDIRGWASVGNVSSATVTGLTLQTGIPYYVSVRAVDGAGWVSGVATSPGQLVGPSLTFAASASVIDFGNLSSANNFQSQQNVAFTTSTNAYGGYQLALRHLSPMQSGSQTFPVAAGTWASPTTNPGPGLSYSSLDPLVGGANRFAGGTQFSAVSSTAEVFADHPGPITGSPITNDSHTLLLRLQAPPLQAAGTYQSSVVVTATAAW